MLPVTDEFTLSEVAKVNNIIVILFVQNLGFTLHRSNA